MVYLETACDNCTVILIDDLTYLTDHLERETGHIDRDGIPAPWIDLERFEQESEALGSAVGQLLDVKDRLVNFDQTILDNVGIDHSEDGSILLQIYSNSR